MKRKALSLLTTATYGAAAVTTAPGSFGSYEAGTLANALRARGRSLFLDSAAFMGLAPTLSPVPNGSWTYPGFDRMFELDDLAGVGAKMIGCAATPASDIPPAPLRLIPGGVEGGFRGLKHKPRTSRNQCGAAGRGRGGNPA